MREISNRYITKPVSKKADGLGLEDGQEFWIHDCYIDLQDNQLDDLDEAVGITHGSHGLIERCVIRGAGKLILCGCGDKDKVPLEYNKRVTFRECIIEQGGRRFPEVQDGMVVYLYDCLIQDWGMKSRFIDRSFGVWAHKSGLVYAQDCVFRQQSLKRGLWYWLMDKIGHICWAVKENGPMALLNRKTYIAGTRRALIMDGSGSVIASNCWKSHKNMVIQYCHSYMSDEEADELIEHLEQMRADLKAKLNIK